MKWEFNYNIMQIILKNKMKGLAFSIYMYYLCAIKMKNIISHKFSICLKQLT